MWALSSDLKGEREGTAKGRGAESRTPQATGEARVQCTESERNPVMGPHWVSDVSIKMGV